VNIPFWLLRLLPMWEYICPKCRKEVKKNSHECPSCGEKYPLAIRVPPSFLKDPKKLEAYVHKHVFPRVSEFERNYLTKYFTTIFSDGFESGDFSAWTATSGTPTVSTNWAHHGIYSCQINAAGEDVSKTFTAANTVYMRVYIKVTSCSLTSGQYATFLFVQNAAADQGIMAQLYHNGSNIVFSLRSYYTPDARWNTAIVLTLDQIYCIELKYVKDSSASLYLDNIEEVTSGTTTFAWQIDRVRVGWNQTGATTFYVDCVVVADAYIGPEAAGGMQLFTLLNEMGY